MQIARAPAQRWVQSNLGRGEAGAGSCRPTAREAGASPQAVCSLPSCATLPKSQGRRQGEEETRLPTGDRAAGSRTETRAPSCDASLNRAACCTAGMGEPPGGKSGTEHTSLPATWLAAAHPPQRTESAGRSLLLVIETSVHLSVRLSTHQPLLPTGPLYSARGSQGHPPACTTRGSGPSTEQPCEKPFPCWF